MKEKAKFWVGKKEDVKKVSLWTPHKVASKGPKFYKESHEVHEMAETPEYEKYEHKMGLEKREKRRHHHKYL